MCGQLETDRSWESERWYCCDPFSMGVGEEESHTEHENSFGKGRGWEPMAHAVPDGAPCRWVFGKGRGEETGCTVFRDTLDLLTLQPAPAAAPLPTPKPPSSGQRSCYGDGLVEESTRNLLGTSRAGWRLCGRRSIPICLPLEALRFWLLGKVSSKRTCPAVPRWGQGTRSNPQRNAWTRLRKPEL